MDHNKTGLELWEQVAGWPTAHLLNVGGELVVEIVEEVSGRRRPGVGQKAQSRLIAHQDQPRVVAGQRAIKDPGPARTIGWDVAGEAADRIREQLRPARSVHGSQKAQQIDGAAHESTIRVIGLQRVSAVRPWDERRPSWENRAGQRRARVVVVSHLPGQSSQGRPELRAIVA